MYPNRQSKHWQFRTGMKPTGALCTKCSTDRWEDLFQLQRQQLHHLNRFKTEALKGGRKRAKDQQKS